MADQQPQGSPTYGGEYTDGRLGSTSPGRLASLSASDDEVRRVGDSVEGSYPSGGVGAEGLSPLAVPSSEKRGLIAGAFDAVRGALLGRYSSTTWGGGGYLERLPPLLLAAREHHTVEGADAPQALHRQLRHILDPVLAPLCAVSRGAFVVSAPASGPAARRRFGPWSAPARAGDATVHPRCFRELAHPQG